MKFLTVKVIGSKPRSLVFVIDMELLKREPVELVDRLLFLKMLDLDWLLPNCGLISVARELLNKEAAAPPLALGVLLSLHPSDGRDRLLLPEGSVFCGTTTRLSPSSSSRSTTSSSDAEGDGEGAGLLGGAIIGMGLGTAFT